jgi:hypothetical protein
MQENYCVGSIVRRTVHAVVSLPFLFKATCRRRALIVATPTQ